jgi:radical SAM superfamily enzyme YgiQ (UPF0313 family)
MRRHPELDYGVFLEGDESAPELLQHLDCPEEVPGVFYRRGGQVRFSGSRCPPDVKSLLTPRRDFVDCASYPERRSIGIQSKRGGVLRCAYCSYPFLNGTEIRLREVRSVVDELEVLQREANVREVMFVDNVFNIPQCRRDMQGDYQARADD